MTSIKAAPFHALTLAVLVAATGSIVQLSRCRPVVDFVQTIHLPGLSRDQRRLQTQGLRSHCRGRPAEKPAPVIKETTAQKRARVAPHIAVAARPAMFPRR